MKIVDALAGLVLVVSGGLFLVAWHRERKHPDQKKLGFGFIIIGALLLLSTCL